MNNFTTTTPFDATDSTGIPTVLSGGNGSNAAGAGTTDVSGNLTAFNITIEGTGYQVGDTVTISEDGGAGVATATVATLEP